MKTFSKKPGGETVRHIPCPLCGEGSFRGKWECDGFAFARCLSCGLIHQNPQPVQEELSSRYDEEYFQYERANEEQFYQLMSKGLEDIRFSDLDNRLGSGGQFLDVGCATGMLISRLAESGWRTRGVEVCEPAARFGVEERGCNIFVGTLEQSGFNDESFDVVHSSHVIEHLTDPSGFAEEVHRILRPGGYMITTTPNSSGLQAALFGGAWRSAIADHMTLFSKQTLSTLLRRCGFEVLRIKTWGGLGVGTAPGWIKRIADVLAKPFGFGDVMIVLARKG